MCPFYFCWSHTVYTGNITEVQCACSVIGSEKSVTYNKLNTALVPLLPQMIVLSLRVYISTITACSFYLNFSHSITF